jgi:hypothetical protein
MSFIRIGNRDEDEAKANDLRGATSHSYGFLSRLWETNMTAGFDAGGGRSYQSMNAAPLAPGQLPSMSYNDAVKRECAKPQRMNPVVSTDYAPLPTRTAAPSFAEFRRTPADGKGSELTYGHLKALRRKYTSDNASTLKNFTQADIDELHGANMMRDTAEDVNERGVVPERYRDAVLQRALEESHFGNLMDAIRTAKMDARRDPLIRELARRENHRQ